MIKKLHAMELFKHTHLVKLELLSNATTIDRALNYIRDKKQQHQQQEKETGKISSVTTTATTNQVF
jgi:hypothetical protein